MSYQRNKTIFGRVGFLGTVINPTQLLNTLVYQIFLNFALRAAGEHKNLRVTNSQIEVRTDVQGYRYLRYTRICQRPTRVALYIKTSPQRLLMLMKHLMKINANVL
eukprot:GHVU01214043.1.p1 GENE.GHVU01214043.1~~GHVU01214043.1.p1  ORF type:complete len:106 (-),score=1.70 GHVU01214043.1:98-415(-)